LIPTVTYFRSSPMVHRYGDLFNLPGLTNFLGCVQCALDITATKSLTFPPLSGSDQSTGALFIDGKYLLSAGSPITFTWYPDRILRETEYDGLRLVSTTALPAGRTAVMVLLRIENLSEREREVEVRIALRSSVTKSNAPWLGSVPPAEQRHEVAVGPRAFSFVAFESGAASFQGTHPAPDRADQDGISFDVALAPRGSWQVSFVHAIGISPHDAKETFDTLVERVPEEIGHTRDEWNLELEAVYTPGNSRYSGSLPVLETSDPSVMRLYHTGVLGVIYFKRDSPHSVIGRAYDTLMPRYWATVTYLWDYSLSSLVHALLDPHVMRKYLELWMRLDIHEHYGTEWLTGGPVGQWYSVNDFAMSKIARDYLRWTGQHDFLTSSTVEHLERYAYNWREFASPSGLADYGGINNLLECVSTYIHEVASLNAANSYNMRFAAEIHEMRGDKSHAKKLRGEASALAEKVKELYVDGAGYWNVRFPDGKLVEVRHCYDFFTVINTMADDLTESQKKEMFEFFMRELRTPAWMHALSPNDHDAIYSVRPDHQWNGAYTAWPAQALTALFRIGQVDAAHEWMQGLAKTANQGPFAQAHFVESAVDPIDGGARKAPSDFPWINDWACSSNGAFASVIIESIFGVNATLTEGITAQPAFGPLDKDSRLTNLSYQGDLYDVDSKGIRPQK
jgi:hypothetical protein